tara:strand:+ start:6555 stop:7802 length:1248 start_codon:yes stop_codon:yes gene_type:complete
MNGNFELLDLKIGVSTYDADLNATGIVVHPFNLNQLMELHYYEDITKANVLVVLKMNDTSSGLLSKLMGMEPIDISWSDGEDNVISYSMIIYDIQDRMIIDGKQSQATIYCVSPDAVKNSATKISKRFGKGGGMFTHDIVEEIISKDLRSDKSVDVDPSQTQLSFVSPYWDPYTIISWLAWRSILQSPSGKTSAGYLFYEDRDGYHFRAMDSLVDQETTRTINVNLDSDEEETNDINIEGFTVAGTSDIFRGLNLGSYASTTFTLDMKDFKYDEIPFYVNDFYPQMKKLNQTSLPEFYKRFGSEENKGKPTRIMSKVMDSAMYTEGTYTQDLTRQLSQSMVRNQFFFNQSATFEYEGKQDLYIGQVVLVNKNDSRSGELDLEISGRYIVGKIYRSFLTERDAMSTRVTLYRDSLG